MWRVGRRSARQRRRPHYTAAVFTLAAVDSALSSVLAVVAIPAGGPVVLAVASVLAVALAVAVIPVMLLVPVVLAVVVALVVVALVDS